jgi:uncharacterized spore protein YtfJ
MTARGGCAVDVQHVLSGAQDAMTARRVFGEPVQVGGVTVLPVAKIGGGGGGGSNVTNPGGQGTTSDQGGVGFGLNAKPAGVYVIRDGNAYWRPAIDVNRVILGGQLVAIAAIWALRPLILRWAINRRALAPAM